MKMEIKVLAFLLVGLIVTKLVVAQDEATLRLPTDTIPMHYRLQLTTDIDKGDFNFSGNVHIRFQALSNTSTITLHYRELTIENINLFYAGNATPVLIESNIIHTVDEVREFLIIPTAQELEIYEQYIVEIAYTGILRDDNIGFYRSSYRDPDGNIHWLATTQFQPTHARDALPCYDEPALRAWFSIEITHNVNYTAISNMPVLSQAIGDDPDYITTIFQETPYIQSYIIGFVVSDFGILSNNDAMEQRVIATPESIELGEGNYALYVGELALTTIENYLNMTYNLPKLDQIAVPDFRWGAMENWGICIYRDVVLLFNDQLGNLRQRDSIVRLIAHEYTVSTRITFFTFAIKF